MPLDPIVAGGPVVSAIAALAFGGLLAELVANLQHIVPAFTPYGPAGQ